MKLSDAQIFQHFQDLSSNSNLGKPRADKRIQVKMPSIVVEKLDELFPDVDRSFVLTQLAAHAIMQELKFRDRQVLKSLADSEQQGLDDMLEYLEERDAQEYR